MTDASITPSTIGGYFTHMIAYTPLPVILAQEGGRIDQGGFTGSGSGTDIDAYWVDDGSTSAVTGIWGELQYSQDHKGDPWSGGQRVFTLGAATPSIGYENVFVADSGSPPRCPVTISNVAYYDNAWNYGLVGPEENFIRYSGDWGCISTQPATGVTDLTAVKSYPANQVNFATPYPAISAFQSIRAYANVDNPLKSSGSDVIYEAAWDIFGQAHTNYDGTTLEIMFWTYNHGQNPHIGSSAPVETGIDLNGDGKLWDLYITPDTAATGGVTDSYSYGIWYLQDEYQEDAGWVDILAGIRYFVQYYVVPSGPGAPSDPLDIPLTQITRGWEICSTNYTPAQFRMHDYRIIFE